MQTNLKAARSTSDERLDQLLAEVDRLRAELTETNRERDTWEKLYGERDAAYKASCDDAQRLWSILVRIENESPETREWFDIAFPGEWYATDPRRLSDREERLARERNK